MGWIISTAILSLLVIGAAVALFRMRNFIRKVADHRDVLMMTMYSVGCDVDKATRSETDIDNLKILCHLVVKSLKNMSSMDAETAGKNKSLVGSIFAECAREAIGTTMELDAEGRYLVRNDDDTKQQGFQ